MSRATTRSASGVAVLGLGRFGKSLALELEAEGTEVLGIDNDRAHRRVAGGPAHALRGGRHHRREAMRQLSCTSSTARSSASAATSSRASSPPRCSSARGPARVGQGDQPRPRPHPEQIGVHHVVRPEHDMGRRVAHLVRGRMLDYIELDDGLRVREGRAAREMLGKPLGESRIAPATASPSSGSSARGGRSPMPRPRPWSSPVTSSSSPAPGRAWSAFAGRRC